MKIDIYLYWTSPPPEPSPGLEKWLFRVAMGWKRNRRIGQMSYTESAEFFQVYIWEYLNVLRPALQEAERSP